MKRKNNNKMIIIILIILLIALAVGYAVFSDTLTISGTANAKGTFDLEFQNAEVVKNVGADITKTTAVIGEDKDTLTVNVADLSYPGSGVEFSVDIVNVGATPAEARAVTPTNVTGSNKIKVNGLDVIQTSHPKIEVGDRCNIHFTVEWPADGEEIPKAESSISFELQIEYTQVTGEIFDGEVYHSDLDKEGNIIRIDRVKKGTLTEIITAEDYGKSINYVATVKNNETQENQEVSNWKVLYNDKNNVYIILDDYLPNKLVPAECNLDTAYTYCVYSNQNRAVLLNGLITKDYWKEFANGVKDAEAIGTPTAECIIKSYNEKHSTNLKYTDYPTIDIDDLYWPHIENVDYGFCIGYWLGTLRLSTDDLLWMIQDIAGGRFRFNCYKYNGQVYDYIRYFAVRPVVKLPTTLKGTIGETVEIK